MSKSKQTVITLTLYLASAISVPIFKDWHLFTTLFVGAMAFDSFMDYIVRREDNVAGFKDKKHLTRYLILTLSTIALACWIYKDQTSYDKEYCISEIKRICESGYEFVESEGFNVSLEQVNSKAAAKSLLLGFASLAMAEDTAGILSEVITFEKENGTTEGYSFSGTVATDGVIKYTGTDNILKEYSTIDYKSDLNKYFAKETDALSSSYLDFMSRAVKDSSKEVFVNNVIYVCTYVGIVYVCCFILRIFWAKRRGLPMIREVE